MKSTELIKPTVLDAPLAYRGDKSVIPNKATGSNGASIEEGFPSITSLPISQGGLPPERADFNGLFYLSTDQKVYLQNGGVITFSEDVSNAIGGYPKGAVLDYIDSFGNYSKVLSLIEDNTYNFVTNPNYIDDSHWKILLSESLMLTSKITNCILEAPNGVATYSGSTVTLKQGLKVLIPDGRNADGTLKNIEYTINADISGELAVSNPAIPMITIFNTVSVEARSADNIYYGLDINKQSILENHDCIYYATDTNYWYYYDTDTSQVKTAPFVPVAIYYKTTGENITSLTPFKTFRAVDYNDTEFMAHQASPSGKYIDLSLKASDDPDGYIAPADGWFVVNKNGNAGQYLSMAGTTSQVQYMIYSSSNNTITALSVPVSKGEKAIIGYTLTGTTNRFRFIYAQGATHD